MNINQILALLRDAGKYIGGGTAIGFVLQNWLHVDLSQLSGALAGLGALVAFGASLWSQFAHTKAQTVVAAADIVPIPAHVQAEAGVTKPVLVPTSPKVKS